MGRLPWSDRYTVEDCRSIDINQLSRDGVFSKGLGNEWTSRWFNQYGEETNSIGLKTESGPNGCIHLVFQYEITDRISGDQETMVYSVPVTSTECYFGGQRYWFICPLKINDQPCHRRVGKLYLPPDSNYFGCRRCHNLTYTSQKEHDKNVDYLRKNPALMLSMIEDGSPRAALAALKAAFRVFGKL